MRFATGIRNAVLAAIALFPAAAAHGGFASTESFLPAVGRVAGQGGAQFYTTVWATNLTSAPVHFTFQFLKQGQANPSPASFADALQPGETKVYANVVGDKLGQSGALGAARVVSDGEVLVAERIYDQPPGTGLGETAGLFFAGVPKSFSISLGQSASIQGVDQGGSEDFRYNFALVETGGAGAAVNVQVFDGSGTLLGQKAYTLLAYEQLQPNVSDVVSGVHTANARITATVTGGTGSILLAGAQLANGSQDSSGFEMSFRDDVLGSGGTAGVTSLNGLAGALTIAHGANTTVNVSGHTITIDAVAGSGTGLTAVAHDNSLAGSGTVSIPLGIANGQVVRSVNGLRDAVTLAAGNNVTITPSGQTLTIAATGGGGGLTLPYTGTTKSDGVPAFSITNTGIEGALYAEGAYGLTGRSTRSDGMGVYGAGGIGVFGEGPTGVYGTDAATNGFGVHGVGGTGVVGEGPVGVSGIGNTSSGTGVVGTGGSASFGVHGKGGTGVFGEGPTGVSGLATTSNGNGVVGTGGSSGKGVYGVAGAGGSGVSGSGYIGVAGEASVANGNGVVGSGGTYGVYCEGNFGATGVKSFVEPHPADPTKEIRYVCLEGRESGTYFRGTGRIVGGFATIEVPEDFRTVTAEKGLTVVVTPVGGLAVLAAVHQGLDRIVIQGSSDVAFNYIVNGVRKAFENHAPVSENTDFVPRSATDTRFTRGLPPESIRRLKANGTLNPDGTINLETARRLGWDQRDAWKRTEER